MGQFFKESKKKCKKSKKAKKLIKKAGLLDKPQNTLAVDV